MQKSITIGGFGERVRNTLQAQITNIETGSHGAQDISTNATCVLYWLNPEQWIPTDKKSKELLRKIFQDDENLDEGAVEWFNNFTIGGYLEIIAKLKSKLKVKKFDPLWTLAFSYTAHLLSNNKVENILDKHTDRDVNKNIILTGIPGTGKTYDVMEFIKLNNYDYEFVQFHPSYDYEDFIEGLKPISNKGGGMSFELVNGPFKELCKRAYANQNAKYVMVIDEINRANLSSVFGELLYCLEYRGEFISTKMTAYIRSLEDQDKAKQLSISEDEADIGKFCIPSNVLILGTMNEIDRSIDAFDLALRRRFIWHEIEFDKEILHFWLLGKENIDTRTIQKITERANNLNKKLKKEIGHNYQVGHAYFFKIVELLGEGNNINHAFENLWAFHLRSLLQEYCKTKFSDNDMVEKLKYFKKIITKP